MFIPTRTGTIPSMIRETPLQEQGFAPSQAGKKSLHAQGRKTYTNRAKISGFLRKFDGFTRKNKKFYLVSLHRQGKGPTWTG